ncbi:MAG: methylmalonyl-CoA mutase family protein [Clostridia bacterium]
MFQEFPLPTYEQWKELAEKALKGASFEKKLMTKTYEGITLQPMYRQVDAKKLSHLAVRPGEAPFVRGTTAGGYLKQPWEVCQELNYASPEAFNEAALHDLQRGQTMLNLVLDRAASAGLDPDRAHYEDVGSKGVSLSTLDDVAKALDRINLEETPLLVQAGSAGLPMLALLGAYAEQKTSADQGTTEQQRFHGTIGMDPLGELVRNGSLSFSLKAGYDSMAQMTHWAKKHMPYLQTILVQGNPYHDGGASAVEELAFAIATGVEYVQQLGERGISVDDAATRMHFSFSIGSNFFMEIAKLRAARMMWAKVIAAFGGSEAAQQMAIHARTSAWTKTVHDPYVNMLRSAAESFAGVLGGADSLHVSPFDEAIRPADSFSRRIARNTQLILQNEAHLTKVVDPAGGSWYIEALTDALAASAWELFQQTEAKGGMAKALQAGFPQEKVAAVAAKRMENISRRKDKMIGTNIYPNGNESKLGSDASEVAAKQANERIAAIAGHRAAVDAKLLDERLQAFAEAASNAASGAAIDAAIAAVKAGATLGDLMRVLGERAGERREEIQAIHAYRGAEPFEALRANAARYKEQHGAAPQVFLAKIGPVAQHKARADFASGFVEAGGFAVAPSQAFAEHEVEAAVQAAAASEACLTVICSSDEAYGSIVPQLAAKLKQVKPEMTIWNAGKPLVEAEEAFRQAGVDDFIYMGANCYDMLMQLQQQKGVAQ